MAEPKTWDKCCRFVFDFFKNDQGKIDFVAISLTLLNVIATFFLLSSLFTFDLDLGNFGALVRTSLALYALFAITLLIFMVITTTLKTKFVRLNIHIFIIYFLIFQLPTMNLTMFILFLILIASLFYYPMTQDHEEKYARVVNIRRRTVSGVYLVIFVSAIIMSYGVTRTVEKYTMNDLVDQAFTDNGSIKTYIHGVYNKYFSTDEFYAMLDEIDMNIRTKPDQVLDSINKLPPQALEAFNNISPEALVKLKSPDTKMNLNLIRGQVLAFTSQLRDPGQKGIIIDRLINIGSGQIKNVLAPYEFYFRFYLGYSFFAALIIASPFLMLLLGWLVLGIFKLMNHYGYVRILKEKVDVEYIEKA